MEMEQVADTLSIVFILTGYSLISSGLCLAKSSTAAYAKHILCTSVYVLTFWLVGYSISFGDPATSNPIFGWSNIALHGASEDDYARFVSHLVSGTTFINIIAGSLVCSAKLEAAMLASIWHAITYSLPCYWIWAPTGWLYSWSVADVGGAGPVYVGAGCVSLVWALMNRNMSAGKKQPGIVKDSLFGASLVCCWWEFGAMASCSNRQCRNKFGAHLQPTAGGYPNKRFAWLNWSEYHWWCMCDGISEGIQQSDRCKVLFYKLIDMTLGLRIDQEQELLGADLIEHGECVNPTEQRILIVSDTSKSCCFPRRPSVYQVNAAAQNARQPVDGNMVIISTEDGHDDTASMVLSELYQQSWTPMLRMPPHQDEAGPSNPEAAQPGACSGAVAWAHAYFNRPDDDQQADGGNHRSSSLDNYL
ncbi:hypothetical protein CAPTEDRAFT_208614 [Capitella teleta]|uniref:Ammonium transporter AmtB-like domain-containing protein n=1 Tax=Capitella teleta TaxID=283909 RepID=R7UIS9_CAPTE|nr:hypothetical protein CAPTEDRAFT_208614 [Capitella teleta]|eukprot:ELU06003.1 hypothetical protein CAPTEDRAFT_208614 [Capitella teleta]